MADHAKFREFDNETGEEFFVCTDCVDDWPCVYAKLEAAKSILWMAEKYAEGGGSRGPEMRDYQAAIDIIGEPRP